MTKSEQLRLTNWRLKLLQAAEHAGNVARTCRHFAISRKTFYKWRQRHHTYGDAGLADRTTVPHRSPWATPPDVVSKILYLRQHYHFGPGKIADYLKRFHDLSIATATVHRILGKHGMNRLPANQKYRRHAHRWTRYEKAQPGHRLQVDVKFLERIPGTRRRFYQFTAIDDCTRIRVLKVYEACNQRTAIEFIDDVLRRLPFRVHVVQTDNGAEFQTHFHWHLEERDIRHVYIRPRTPHLNGKVERSHRVDDQSSTSSSTRTASRTIFTCSTRSSKSGRTITITTDRMERWRAKRRTSGSWQRRGPARHRRPENLQVHRSHIGHRRIS
jgi:transposase InsO family protein